MSKSRRLGDLRLEHLERLPLNGKLIDTYDFARCLQYNYIDERTLNDSTSFALKLCNEEGAELELMLKGIRSIHVPDGGPHLWMPEFEVLDVRDRGMEGIRFIVQSEMGEGLRCHCMSVECISFRPGTST